MRFFRALVQRSPWVRGACLVLLLIFILICGVHLAGIHHDSDSDGLDLVDWLTAILLIALLALALIAPVRRRTGCASDARPALSEIFSGTAIEAPHSRMVDPLRC
ncbi:MAG: hypothetical protein ABR529_14030 [Actinomycetota bacterium]